MKSIDKVLRKLHTALRTLEGTEGRAIARRNARGRTLSAMRALRATVDAGWPAIVSRKGVKRLTVDGRIARLKRAGWRPVEDDREVAIFAVEGVPVRHISGTVGENYWVPGWAVAIGCNKSAQLRAARRDRMAQRAALAAAALR